MTGPSYSSFHEGTDVSLYQPWNTTLNSYRLGVDFRVVRGTVLSYDETLDYYKGDTFWELAPTVQASLPGAQGPVELGLPFNTAAGNPCSLAKGTTTLIANGVLTNPTCNGYFSYSRTERVRTSFPTEQISLRSNTLNWLDFAGTYSYSSGDSNIPLSESFNGLVSRSELRAYNASGPARAQEITNNADFTATIKLAPKWRIIDTFRYWAYRIPESLIYSETDFTVPGGSCAPPTCSLTTPISDTVQSTSVTPTNASFNQQFTRNQIQLAWDPTRKIGGSIGFAYFDQDFTHYLDYLTGDVDNIIVHSFAGLLNVWARPTKQLRLNFSGQWTDRDNTIVRIGPRKESRYVIQANYTPRPWAVLGAAINLNQQNNGDALVDYRGHFRNYGFTAALVPKQWFSLDLTYNFNDVQQNAFICFNDTPPTGVTLPVVTNAGSCVATQSDPNNPYNDPGNPLLTGGNYTNSTNYGSFTAIIKPVHRLTTRLGYSIVSVDGTIPQFNILQPLGPLNYKWQQPIAGVSWDFGHGVAGNAYYNYYQYGEGSFVGPTANRYFHANNATLSFTYAF
jgi:hypothetical protein